MLSSFMMAAVFVVGVAHKKAFTRFRRDGGTVPARLVPFSVSLGIAIGGALVFGLLLVLRGL